MTAVSKIVNYTPEQTTQLVEAYQAGTPIEQIAQLLQKTTRSVVAKLSREGVYKSVRATTQPQRVRKAELVDQLAQHCAVPCELFESLEKANYEVLELLLASLQKTSQPG